MYASRIRASRWHPQEKEEGEEREKVQRASAAVAAQRRSTSSAHHQKTATPAPPPPATQVPQQSKAHPTPSCKKSAPATALQSAKAARVAVPRAASAPAPAQPSSSKPRSTEAHPTRSPARPAVAPPTAAMDYRDVEDFEIRGPIAPITASARRLSTATATTSAVADGSIDRLAWLAHGIRRSGPACPSRAVQ